MSITKEGALALLEALGKKGEVSSGWVRSNCPLAPYLHEKGTDNKPSFGIRLDTGRYNCFSCNSGSLTSLLLELEFHGYDADQLKLARAVLNNVELEVPPLPAFTEFDAPSHPPFEEWPEYWLDQFPSAVAVPVALKYLEGRGLTLQEIADHDLRFDIVRQMVVYPFRNAYGKFAGARGRAVNPDGLQHFDYTWNEVNNTKMVWYNEPALAKGKPVVVVEGQLDCIKVLRHYDCVVAGMTAKPTPEKLRKLMQAPAVVLMLDNDHTGRMARERFVKALGDDVPLALIDLPAGVKDPDKADPEWLKSVFNELDLS